MDFIYQSKTNVKRDLIIILSYYIKCYKTKNLYERKVVMISFEKQNYSYVKAHRVYKKLSIFMKVGAIMIIVLIKIIQNKCT